MTAKNRLGDTITEGDIVGPAIHTYRDGEITGTLVPVTGQVLRLYQHGVAGKWRAQILWKNPRLGFLYTGNQNWEFVSRLILVKRGSLYAKR